MKKITSLILLSVFISSCASIAQPTPTTTPQPTLTFTPTLTPTITPTPTATPDPDKPTDATGQDPVTGEYIKTVEENGRTIRYVWKKLQFGNDAENGVKGHWFESRMANEPIDLTGYGENAREEYWGDFKFELEVYAMEGLRDLDAVGYLCHPNVESDFVKYDVHSFTLASSIMFDMFLLYYDLVSGSPGSRGMDKFEKFDAKYANNREQTLTDGKDFVTALNNGVTIDVGGEEWEPRKGYAVYWIDETAVAEDSSMHKSIQNYTVINFYWKVIIDNGKLTAILAPSKWLRTEINSRNESRRERYFRIATLFLLQAIINGRTPDKEISIIPYQHYSGIAGPGMSMRSATRSVTIETSFIDFTLDPPNCP